MSRSAKGSPRGSSPGLRVAAEFAAYAVVAVLFAGPIHLAAKTHERSAPSIEDPRHASARGGTTGPVQVSLARVSTPKPDGTRWNAPGTVMFRDQLIIDLGAPLRVASVELSLDHNDRYRVSFFGGEHAVGRPVLVGPTDQAEGLHTYRIPLPVDSATTAIDAIRVAAESGDQNFSLGHVTLHADR
jgi:hypothetical protein